MDSETLMERCAGLGLPHAPIRRPQDLYDDPHLRASGGLLELTLDDGRKTEIPALPITLGGQRPGVRLDIPGRGQHSRAVAEEAGLEAEEIEALFAAGVLT